MLTAIIAISAVLLLVIFALVFRVQTLVSVLKGSADNNGGGLNKLSALLFLVFLVVGLSAFYYYTFTLDYHLPESASEHGLKTDKMFLISMIIIIIAFTITQIMLFTFSYLFQYKEGRKASFYAHNSKLELYWTLIPAIVLTVLIWDGWKTWSKITTIPAKTEDAERVELEIMGQQFLWQVRYPGKDGEFGRHHFKLIDEINQFGLDFSDKTSFDDFVPREIHLPIGKNVLFKIRAKDVLHSVYAPHFRLKMDAVPGMPTKFYFKPIKTTAQMRTELNNPDFNYEIACAEMCGKGHFGMRYIIVVEDEASYKKWYAEQQTWSELNKDYVESKLANENLTAFKNWLLNKSSQESTLALK